MLAAGLAHGPLIQKAERSVEALSEWPCVFDGCTQMPFADVLRPVTPAFECFGQGGDLRWDTPGDWPKAGACGVSPGQQGGAARGAGAFGIEACEASSGSGQLVHVGGRDRWIVALDPEIVVSQVVQAVTCCS